MVFSTNQVRQLFVVKNVSPSAPLANPGDTKAFAIDGVGGDLSKPAFVIQNVNANGEIVKSDYIIVPQIRHANFKFASTLRTKLPFKYITNTLTAGTDYQNGDVFYVNFTFPAYISLTDEEDMTKTVAMRYNYNEQGVLYTTETYSGVTLLNNWAAQMAKALNSAFNARQNMDNTLLSFGIVSGTTNIVYIATKAPVWRRGLAENRVNQYHISNLTFENRHNAALSTLPLENNSRVSVYGTVTESATAVQGLYDGSTTATTPAVAMNNGRMIADLEYFCMGERGDIYRMKGWPNYIETKYLVDPDKEYDVVDIHHYYQGEGTNDDKSEKVTTLVIEVDPTDGSQLGNVDTIQKLISWLTGN